MLAWFAAAGRDLPWRAPATRTRSWWRRCWRSRPRRPGGHGLAAVPRSVPHGRRPRRRHPAAVLRAWQGLGYNRRALALRAAAKAVVAMGGWPRDLAGLAALPGSAPTPPARWPASPTASRSPRSTPMWPGCWPVPSPGPTLAARPRGPPAPGRRRHAGRTGLGVDLGADGPRRGPLPPPPPLRRLPAGGALRLEGARSGRATAGRQAAGGALRQLRAALARRGGARPGRRS